MRFVTYTATPGLELFPEPDRFGLWRSAHKRLMQEDPDYREKVRGFRRRMILTSVCTGTLPTALILILCFIVLPAAQGHKILSRLADVSLIIVAVGSVLYIIWTVWQDIRAAVRMQEFMNERIGRELQSLV